MSEDRLEQALDEMRQEPVAPATLEAARARVWGEIASFAGTTCAEFRPEFAPYISGALAGPRRLLLDDHLSRCPACRAAMAAIRGERRVIARLLDGPIGVLATGGGAFMDPETRARIRTRAITVWLKADLDTLVERVSRRGHRPLLNDGDPREVLTRLMTVRSPVYAEADITVETGHAPTAATVERVIEALAAFRARAGAERPP